MCVCVCIDTSHADVDLNRAEQYPRTYDKQV